MCGMMAKREKGKATSDFCVPPHRFLINPARPITLAQIISDHSRSYQIIPPGIPWLRGGGPPLLFAVMTVLVAGGPVAKNSALGPPEEGTRGGATPSRACISFASLTAARTHRLPSSSSGGDGLRCSSAPPRVGPS